MNPLFLLIPLVLIALAACSTGGNTTPTSSPSVQADPTPAPAPQPSPAPAPQPVTEPDPPPAPTPPPPAAAVPLPAKCVFVADFTGPSIGLMGFMVRAVPPRYSSGDPNAKWFTNAAEGLGGFACVDPAPNAGYHCEDGCLVMTPGTQPPNTGFPIISARTFSKDFPLALTCEILFGDVAQFGAYGGPVWDNGEDNYSSLYGQNCDGATIGLIIDQTSKGSPPMGAVEPAVWHKMQINYYPDGTWRWVFNGVECQPTGIDNPLPLKNDPRLSIFCGGFKVMKVRNLRVFTDDPNATAV